MKKNDYDDKCILQYYKVTFNKNVHYIEAFCIKLKNMIYFIYN